MSTALIALVLAPLVATFVTLPLRHGQVRLIEGANVLSAGIGAALAALLAFHVSRYGEVHALGGFLVLDAFGALLTLTTTLVSLFVVLYSVGYMRIEVVQNFVGFRRVRQYFALTSLFVFAMLLALSAGNPIVMWIAIEATTLSTAFLVSFHNKPSATEAAWKYLILNSLGLLLGLLGTLLFLAFPEAGAATWVALAHGASAFDPLAVKIAFALVLVGYGTKVGFVPFHTWKPDAYAKVPTPLAALFSGVLMNVAFFAILRFKEVADAALPGFASTLLITAGVLSIGVSALIMYTQRNYKRLLAYSSIEHAGILALGFGFSGIGTAAAMLHMFYHALVKALLFLCSSTVFLRYASTKMYRVSGMSVALPATALLFFGGILAIAAMPPFGTFGTEFSILFAGAVAHPYLVAVALAALTIAFIALLKHLSGMFFGPVPDGITTGEPRGIITIVPIIFGAFIIGASFYLPQFFIDLIGKAAAELTLH